MQKAAEYFNVDYRSILNNLDTKIATRKDGKLVLLFSYELSRSPLRGEKEKELLLNNIKKAMNETSAVWVYKNVNDKLILLDNNKPSYNSKLKASNELKISTKTINKYLDTDKEYKGLYFYSVAL